MADDDKKISQLTEKQTLVGNDVITILDSEASNANKKAKVSAVTALSTYTASSPIAIIDKVVSISTADTNTSGAISSTDWNTFNGKQDAITASAPLDLTSNTLTISQSGVDADGYLSSTNWVTFNSKANTQKRVVDESSTTPSLDISTSSFYNQLYIYTQPLTSLTLTNSYPDSNTSQYRYETEIQFTTGSSFTFTATGLANKWLGITSPSFDASSSYVIVVKNGYAVCSKVGA